MHLEEMVSDGALNNYEQRIVAFIDILGFANMVSSIERQPHLFDKILTTLSKLHSDTEYAFARDDKYPQFHIKGGQYSLFSDSIVLSCLDIPENYSKFLEQLSTFSFELLIDGILIRGGVTRGRLFHDRNRLFGQGMIDAYHLESRLAIFPRIIISDELAKHFRNQNKSTLGHGTLREDFDGTWFVDYLSALWDGADSNDEAAEGIGQLIANVLANAPSGQYVQAKLRWLKSYFNAVAEEHGMSRPFAFHA